MAEIEIRAERLEQYEQKAIEKQHNRRKNQMLNQGFSVSTEILRRGQKIFKFP